MAFLNLFKDALLVLTDSGGLQEETTALGIPCLTLRETTERPITVEQGTNVVVGTSPMRIAAEAEKILRGEGKAGRRPPLWDGRAAERIADALAVRLAVPTAPAGLPTSEAMT
jgi:UDP-N-acetylglucosamine 2-epimerase (non-hydrolysing)